MKLSIQVKKLCRKLNNKHYSRTWSPMDEARIVLVFPGTAVAIPRISRTERSAIRR